jgi:hypothetical protein
MKLLPSLGRGAPSRILAHQLEHGPIGVPVGVGEPAWGYAVADRPDDQIIAGGQLRDQFPC